MAKSKSKNRTLRGNISTASHRLQRPATTPTLTNFGSPIYLLEDRRQYHPDGPYRSARGFTTSAPQLVAREPRSTGGNTFRPYNAQTKAIVAFSAPKRVAVCVRRKIRKEIMHAMGAAGGKVRKPKRNFMSNHRC